MWHWSADAALTHVECWPCVDRKVKVWSCGVSCPSGVANHLASAQHISFLDDLAREMAVERDEIVIVLNHNEFPIRAFVAIGVLVSRSNDRAILGC